MRVHSHWTPQSEVLIGDTASGLSLAGSHSQQWRSWRALGLTPSWVL